MNQPSSQPLPSERPDTPDAAFLRCGINLPEDLYADAATVARVRKAFAEWGFDFAPYEPLAVAERVLVAFEGTVLEKDDVALEDYTNFDAQVAHEAFHAQGISAQVAEAVLRLLATDLPGLV